MVDTELLKVSSTSDYGRWHALMEQKKVILSEYDEPEAASVGRRILDEEKDRLANEQRAAEIRRAAAEKDRPQRLQMVEDELSRVSPEREYQWWRTLMEQKRRILSENDDPMATFVANQILAVEKSHRASE